MPTLLSELHFWTTQEDVIIKHSDYGSFKYYPRKDNSDSLSLQSKKQYCEQRDVTWSSHNKRPHKLRDRLKELEEHLIHNKIVFIVWKNGNLQLLLSTGLIVNITVNDKTGDIINVIFDKQLSAKLQVNIICDGTIIDNQVICICNDGHVFGYGGQWKDGWVLEGGPRRRLNYHGEWLAVWGKAGAEHPQPWSPIAKNHQRANLHLYWIGARDPELLAYKKTDGEPLQVAVSKRCSRTLIVIEQKITQRGAVSVEVNSFELVKNNLKRISVTSVPLQTHVSSTALNESEDRLLISCLDGSIALLDRIRGSTRTVKAAFVPTFATWHYQGAIVAISNERGQLQYYDTALNCVKSQILAEDCIPTAIVDLSSYFNMRFSVACLHWGPKDLILSLEQGPIALITHVERSLSFNIIIQKYLSTGKVDKAIKLLLSWEFNEESFCALQRIVAYLMREPLTEEVAQHLQNSLGSYHNSPVPLRPQVRHRYGNQVFSLTRRFFHQLVRAGMYETAFLLAVDIGHHDLFMDLHYIALKIDESEMAAAARAQASALLSRCSSEASNCSRSSCSQCCDSASSSSNDYSPTNRKEEKDSKETTDKLDHIPSVVQNSDSCLTSDRTSPEPISPKMTTEKEIFPTMSKLSFTPRATYVKSPQVPSNFTKVNLGNLNVSTPPLPFTPPLPTLHGNSLNTSYMQNCTTFKNSFQSSAGFPYNHPANVNSPANFLPHHNFFNSNISNSSFMSGSLANISSNQKLPHHPLYSAFSSSNLSVNNIKKSFTPINKVLTPPLPSLSNNGISSHYVDSVIIPSNLNQSFANHSNSSSSSALISSSESSPSTTGKKHQPKVKFSDTVTAFIVPEIKRPQRPPPPPHITDPQKELADSLPLCHPNEDYLKDFAPAKKDDNQDEEGPQSKIKVVHFGVV